MSNKQTAVEWIKNELFVKHGLPINKESNPELFNLLEQAKEIEKQQIIDAHGIVEYEIDQRNRKYGEQYYLETYGK